MQTIETRFRGSRIAATSSSGKRIVLSLQPEWSIDEAHKQAAVALCKKLKWIGQPFEMVGGQTKKGMVWVFASGDDRFSISDEKVFCRKCGRFLLREDAVIDEDESGNMHPYCSQRCLETH